MENKNLMIPNHVGIIMDENGRWAKERHLPISFGHKEGVQNIKKLLPYIYDCGVSYVVSIRLFGILLSINLFSRF